MFPWWPNLSWASTNTVYFHDLGMTRARNFWPESIMCLYSKPLKCVKRSVSCCGAFPFDNLLDILLQKVSVFCICRRACNLSAVRDFGVGSFASDASGITSGCKVEVSVDRRSWVWLLVLNAGLSVFVTDDMLIDTGSSWGNSTRHERQSAVLLYAPEIHSKVMLYVANSSPHLLTLLFTFFPLRNLLSGLWSFCTMISVPWR